MSDEIKNMMTQEEYDQIIAAVREETGMTPAILTPAISFGEDNPENKAYIILLSIFDDGETLREWTVVIGRQNVFDCLKDYVIDEVIDPYESFVIAGKTDFDNNNIDMASKPITVFRFLKVMSDTNKVLVDKEEFDIDEYEPSVPDKTILDVF